MAISVARVHLKVAHAALPALLPTPPKCKMLPVLPTPPLCVAAILPKSPLTRPGRADADERWDARKIKPASEEPAASSASGLRSANGVVRNTVGHGPPRKNVTSPPPKPCRADAVETWDAHKMAASPAASSSSSSCTSSLISSMRTISRASSVELWDVHKKRRPPQDNQLLHDGESRSSSTVSNDLDTEDEEIVWKPRAMYAGPGFIVATPESSMLPMPTAFLVPVA